MSNHVYRMNNGDLRAQAEKMLRITQTTLDLADATMAHYDATNTPYEPMHPDTVRAYYRAIALYIGTIELLDFVEASGLNHGAPQESSPELADPPAEDEPQETPEPVKKKWSNLF